MNLTNATALVTGGSSGIGKGIAEALIAAGAKVAITGRNKEKLDAAASSLGAVAIHADVSKEADVLRTMQEAVARLGPLDILINNAGVGTFKPLLEMDLAGFERVFATNVTGAMLMAREAARHFAQRKKGHIVNIGSTASHRGAPNGTAYYASKFALRGMTECWRAELRKHNIRVMLVNPSEVMTNFGAAAGFEQKANDSKLRAAEIAHAVRAALEMDDRGFTTEVTIFATNPVD
jgi:3-oxoacyl-[acyl-carrier protein] reductase